MVIRVMVLRGSDHGLVFISVNVPQQPASGRLEWAGGVNRPTLAKSTRTRLSRPSGPGQPRSRSVASNRFKPLFLQVATGTAGRRHSSSWILTCLLVFSSRFPASPGPQKNRRRS